ncbi:hypothetical protein [Streptomyces violascens]|uniref:hypothetical protein n=1 Tax=Streptomyces violascens TaxID=67381 RepID=UPI0036C2E4B5
MTGPEHYREAERLLTEAAAEGAEGTYFVRPESLAAAQVHATLALAAATALIDSGGGTGMPIDDYHAWAKAASQEERGQR